MRAEYITGEQIRAARAAIRLGQAELAQRCNLSLETIRRLERTRGRVNANLRTISDIVSVLQDLGCVFEGPDNSGPGVRLRHEPSGPARAQSRLSPDPFQGLSGATTIHRLIYCSVLPIEEPGALDSELARISAAGSVRNASCGVSGALAVRDGRALGLLEGPRSAVFDIYGLIATDPVHHDVNIIDSGDISKPRRSEAPMVCAGIRDSDAWRERSHGLKSKFRPESFSGVEAIRILDLVRGDPFAHGGRPRPGGFHVDHVDHHQESSA